jgi:hypothetical protein
LDPSCAKTDDEHSASLVVEKSACGYLIGSLPYNSVEVLGGQVSPLIKLQVITVSMYQIFRLLMFHAMPFCRKKLNIVGMP